ncbi:MAG: Gfo/Idh/MocA family oxidoreductase [Oscillospiraceae bacterium]|nr:Gfo/Idh/MocA family oxidoreductase [Oscillospiraceae bacterium]
MKHRIAIIGLGGMGTWHLNELETFNEPEVAGIWDIKEQRREYARSRNVFVYDSLEALMADKTVDLVLIATPNDMHKPLAIQAMEAGKNVISEKPITICSEDLQEMIAASERTGKFLTVHQNRRWDEDFLTVKEILKEGKLGPVYRIESRVQGAHGIPGDWRQEPEKGGGMILDWGVHLLDQALLLYPDAKIETVYATVTNVTNTKVDDGFTADLGMSNGVHIMVEVGTSNFITLPRWVVLGVDGTAVIEDWKLTGKQVCAHGNDEKDVVPVITAAGLTKTMAPRREDTIATYPLPEVHSDVRDFYRNVVAHLNGEAERLIKLPQVTRVMKLMEAIRASAESKQVVHLEQ